MTKADEVQLKKRLFEISTPEEFIKFVAEFHGFDVEAIRGKSRKSELVDVRAKIAKALRLKWNMTAISIGRLLNRDHTSILNLCKRPVSKLWKVPENPLDGVCDFEEQKKDTKNQTQVINNQPTS